MSIKSTYIHIPSYVRICTYCGLNKYFIDKQLVDEYISALIREMKTSEIRSLETMYVGRGTPTALDLKQLKTLLKAIQSTFSIKGEYTFEANLDELTLDKVKLLHSYGVNRISMGVQTFRLELLKILGRTRKIQDIYNAVDYARKADTESISLDLMYHLPTQTLDDFSDSLDRAIQMDIDHISSYGLISEPKTQFYNMYRKGKLRLPSEDLGAEIYQYLMNVLGKTPFKQYEISNFTKSHHESRHSKTYWLNEEYYGFGAGTSGYVNGERYSNLSPVNCYINTINNHQRPILTSNFPTRSERMEEEMFLGLRMNKGVDKVKLLSKFGTSMDKVFGETINNLKKKNLLYERDNHISLTNRGKTIGNEVFKVFLLDQ